MLIDYNGEKLVIKPANVEDLGLPEVEGDKERLFILFNRDDVEYVRRAHTSKKPPAEGERPFFVKIDGGMVPVAEVAPFTWCEFDGRELHLQAEGL